MQKKRSRLSSLTGPIEQSGAAPSGLNLADAEANSVTSATVPARADGILPIVGLGGSAGGIAAMQEFFKAMPADSGMAFVIILHLSPEHESTLPEMFQRCTPMPVVVAKDGATVAANSVYVIPPGKFLASANGHLHLTVAQEPRGKRMAVDYFFRTLAETHGAQCVGVVLSGAGGDGALGLKRIKELGGLTIAQDPDEAEHADMPRSAIATGVVDWVLGVKEMPAKLVAYVQHRGELKLPAEEGPHPAQPAELSPDEHEAALRDVLAFLRTRTGRDFSYYKRATILRRIARRMQVNGLADLPGYLGFLRTHAGEAGALLQDLLISVTNFFRDPDSFTALERIVPELFAGKGPGDSVRVWVAGCATGEEAYSIAMLLCEHARTLEVPPQIQVFATDLDEDVIREARDGIYPETITTDVSEDRLRRFFLHEHAGYRLRREVRETVLFAPHDLLKDSPFSRLDLISCRNLLIYLNREAQQRAFDIFHFALRPGGHLFLGTSETVEDGSPLFAVIDKKQRLYLQRPGPRQILAVPAGPSTLARALELQERSRERPTVPGRVTVEGVQAGLDKAAPFDSGLPPGELHYRLIERFSPPSILVNAAHDIVHLSEAAGRFLQIAGGEPTRNLLRAVHPMLRIELRAALYAAKQTHTAATAFHVPVEMGEERSLVDIRVTPASDLAPDFLLVVFEAHPADGAAAVAVPRSAAADQAAQHLERELEATKAHLRDTIEESEASTEELKASNEELQAMNEELRSATEELETSREELQSINEELTTVNDEMKSKVDQLARSNSDLQNLMTATDIAIVFLDRDLRIMRFTPSAKTLFNFIPTDLGRPLSDLTRQLDYPEIVADAERALAHLQPAEREVRAGDHYYLARTLPYRTEDDHIAGVVLTFLDITTRKAAEEEFRRSEGLYRAIGESIEYGVWVCAPDGRNTYASPSFLKLVGLTQEQCSNFGWGEVLHPEDAAGTIAAWQECVNTGKMWNREHRFRGVDGQWHAILARGVAVKDAGGQIVCWAGINLDITDRKAAEEALRTSNQRTLLATQATGVGIWEWNVLTGELRWDIQMFRLYGITPTADGFVTYSTWSQAVLPEELQEQEAILQDTVRRAGDSSRTFRIRRKNDGEYRHLAAVEITRTNAQGQTEWVIGTNLDVTESRKAEATLRQNEALFSTLIEQAPLGVYVVDAQFRFQQVNSLAQPVFGDYRALLGRDFTEVMILCWGPAVGPDVARIFRNTLETGERYISPPFVHDRADLGVEQAFDWETQRVTLPDGQHGVVCYFVDVTERRRNEAALRDAKEAAETANQSKDRFLAVLSHELRTPLTPVLMVASALEHDPDLRPEIREDIVMIKRNVELETKLIDDLLDLSRITSGKVELKREGVDLNATVRQVCGICQSQVADQEIQLKVELKDDVAVIAADPARLQQVLWNVIKNAIKFTPAQGTVLVSTARIGPDRCEVRVQDSGIGIPPDILPRIFNAFEQGDAHITRQFGGLGLGLAISRALVELHGGTIRAESQGQGQGATFIVELPGRPPAAAVAAPASTAALPGVSPLRLLLVEDHADTARTLARMLRAKGFAVHAAGDVASAIAAVELEHFDVLVSDLGLPDGDGYEVMRAVRARCLVPGIAMSGYGMEEDILRSADAGFTEHLVKPINVTHLIDAIRRVTDHRGGPPKA